MVSPQNSTNPETTVIGRTDRGFVQEYTTIAGQPALAPAYVSAPWPHHYFWGSVIAGTVSVMAIGFLSMALMFGCHVGTYENGAISFGWGAGIWVVVTAAIAYYVGGMVASSFGDARQSGWLRGMTVWGISVPLTFLVIAIIAGGFGLAYGPSSRVAEQVMTNTHAATLRHGDLFVNFGGAWTVFISLIVGLFCALLGGSTGGRNMDRVMTNLPGADSTTSATTR